MNHPNVQAANIVKLEKISLTLPGNAGYINILHDIDLEVSQNETLAITGPSGSGKTSLLMVIAGLEAPTSGHIEVGGENMLTKNEDDLALFRGQNIGVVFQAFHLIPTMTALENVAVPLEFAYQPNAREQAAETLTKLGLGHRLHHYPAQLSGGEQQRVAIARAFVTRPRLLLADEPTGNLDHETGEQVIDLLFNLRKEHGTTLLLITHDRELAKRCHREIHLSDGKIV